METEDDKYTQAVGPAEDQMASAWLSLQRAMINDSGRWMSHGIAQSFADYYEKFHNARAEYLEEGKRGD